MPSIRSRILAIDDDGHTLDILQRALAQQGFAVAAADTGEEGLARFTAEAFDLVLLDLVMPGMDGLAVLQRLKAQDPEAAVIIMTGHSSTESVVQAMKAGAVDYLTKPLDLDHVKMAEGGECCCVREHKVYSYYSPLRRDWVLADLPDMGWPQGDPDA